MPEIASPSRSSAASPAVRAADRTETEGTLRAVIYLRVSTMGQVNTDYDTDGFSIAAQRDACRKKAESMGAVVVDEYVDKGESARKADRPALQTMLHRLSEERDIHLVITFKVDRIARNRDDDVAINIAIRQAGARLVSVSENIDETPSGKLLHALMSGVAEFYSANLSHEVSKKMAEKAKKGGTLTRAPVGYMNVRDHLEDREVRTVAIDPDRAPLVIWAIEAYATGNYTISQLHDELVARGMTTRAGAKAGKPIGRSQVAQMLTNRYYLGYVTHKGIEYPGRHEPLIDPVTWARVQAILDGNRQGEKQRKFPHYLKGTIVCGRCGSRLSFSRSRGRHGGLYDYFFCLAHQMKRNDCDLPNLTAYEVEDAIEAYYERLHLPADRADRLRELVDEALVTHTAHARAEQKRQDRRIQKLTRETDKLLQLHYTGDFPVDVIVAEQQRIRREMDEAINAREAASADTDEIRTNLNAALKRLDNPKATYGDLGPVARKHMNQAFFDYIAVDLEGITQAKLSDSYAAILADDLIPRLEKELSNPDLHGLGRGSRELAMVGAEGLEPPTSAL